MKKAPTADQLRDTLKARYPGVRFKVIGGQSKWGVGYDVKWRGGPGKSAVTRLIDASTPTPPGLYLERA